jgi:hypothetical protein
MSDVKLAMGSNRIGSFLKCRAILIGHCDANEGGISPSLAFVSGTTVSQNADESGLLNCGSGAIPTGAISHLDMTE